MRVGEKWVPLKTDITVAPAGAKSRGKNARAPADGKAAAEKKAGDSPAKAKAPVGPVQHPLPAKPASSVAVDTAAKGPTTAATAAPADPSSSGSNPDSSSQPASATAPSDATFSTPATTAASSSTDAAEAGHSAHGHANAGPHGSAAGRGRGRGGAPTRGTTRGRGGLPVNNPNRFFQQQQYAAMQAVGYVPVAPEADPTGASVLDAFGKPVPQPVLPPAAGPVQIDPRMLDPTRYWLLGQIEWWFSVDNLCRDLFLRQSVRTSLISATEEEELTGGSCASRRWTRRAGFRSH